MEIECMDFSQDRFTKRFSQKDKEILRFYQNLSYDKESIAEVLERPVHNHTEQLADIIRKDMSKYGLSDAQRQNIQKLRNGHRVIIGGQQAGLFMSPAYIMHKIITLIVLTNELEEAHGYAAVPVFWVAGEDHDFDEVNHTHIYDKNHRRRRKIAYKPNLTVPMSLGYYKYDKEEMKRTLDRIIEGCGDSGFLNDKRDAVYTMIDGNDYWTELFHALVHDAFKEDGLIIFNGHTKAVRELEIPMFEQMILRHEEIDRAFRDSQQRFIQTADAGPMIETDTNVHLFTGSEYSRTLVNYDGENYISDGAPMSRAALIDRLKEEPETFSSNVVTRPLMQEMLFNTLIFAGGGAEVKYWGELHGVFESLDIPMPIVLKRMEIIHEDARTSKLMDRYDLSLTPGLMEEVRKTKDRLIDSNTDESMIAELDGIGEDLKTKYADVAAGRGREQYRQLIEANMKMHQKQLEYLKRRYHLEVKRSLRQQLNDLDEVVERLVPNGSLQERVYHPWMFPHQSASFPPLSYTTQLTILKTL